MKKNYLIKYVVIFTIVSIGILLGVMVCNNQAYGYNRTFFDMIYNFDYAIVFAPGGDALAQGKVQSWTDWEDSDAIQVKIDDVTYYTHLSNVILENRYE